LDYVQLTPERLEDFRDFCCGSEAWSEDLRDFLLNEAQHQGEALLNTTYLWYDDEGAAVAFVAVSMDHAANDKESPVAPDSPYRKIPALLIGRLGVDERHQRKGIGSVIMSFVRTLAADSGIGCRFIAVDVDKENVAAIGFYSREGFIKAPMVRKNLDLMLYDLLASHKAKPRASAGQ
jgi:GNAT superfamily N-acetyltransferase